MVSLFRKMAQRLHLTTPARDPWEPGCDQRGGFSLHESVEAQAGSPYGRQPGRFIAWANDLAALTRLANSRRMDRFFVLTADGACDESSMGQFAANFDIMTTAQRFEAAMAVA